MRTGTELRPLALLAAASTQQRNSERRGFSRPPCGCNRQLKLGAPARVYEEGRVPTAAAMQAPARLARTPAAEGRRTGSLWPCRTALQPLLEQLAPLISLFKSQHQIQYVCVARLRRKIPIEDYKDGPDGLKYYDMIDGTGAEAKVGQRVAIVSGRPRSGPRRPRAARGRGGSAAPGGAGEQGCGATAARRLLNGARTRDALCGAPPVPTPLPRPPPHARALVPVQHFDVKFRGITLQTSR